MSTATNLPYADKATAFAQALVEQRYNDAHAMLTRNLRSNISSDDLRTEYETMVEYGTGPVKVDGYIHTMEDWPAKQPNDAGWVYVSISGEDFAEAVTVVVTVVVSAEGNELKIRDIEWGRP